MSPSTSLMYDEKSNKVGTSSSTLNWDGNTIVGASFTGFIVTDIVWLVDALPLSEILSLR